MVGCSTAAAFRSFAAALLWHQACMTPGITPSSIPPAYLLLAQPWRCQQRLRLPAQVLRLHLMLQGRPCVPVWCGTAGRDVVVQGPSLPEYVLHALRPYSRVLKHTALLHRWKRTAFPVQTHWPHPTHLLACWCCCSSVRSSSPSCHSSLTAGSLLLAAPRCLRRVRGVGSRRISLLLALLSLLWCCLLPLCLLLRRLQAAALLLLVLGLLLLAPLGRRPAARCCCSRAERWLGCWFAPLLCGWLLNHLQVTLQQ